MKNMHLLKASKAMVWKCRVFQKNVTINAKNNKNIALAEKIL